MVSTFTIRALSKADALTIARAKLSKLKATAVDKKLAMPWVR